MPYTIEIDETKCNGCGICIQNCDHMVLEIKQVNDDNKIANKHNPEACAFCLNCLVGCPQEAIYVAEDKGPGNNNSREQ